MIEVINNKIRMPIGDTGSIKINLFAVDGTTTYPLTDGDKVVFQVKKEVTDAEALITKEMATDGSITFSSSDTASLEAGVYAWGTALINSINNTKDSFIPVADLVLYRGVVA
jgi:uncharacterized protein YbcV (DUF1398 family)